MIDFNYELNFTLADPEKYTEWLEAVIHSERMKVGNIHYIFTSDEGLLQLNTDFLGHDYFTDILSFDYTEGDVVSGDIFISIERVRENAGTYAVPFEDELRRVMVHGILHLLGHKDETPDQKKGMRLKEDEKMTMFHVEQ